ncbi:hypothetical protein SLNWT_7145 [Streptomyces albus]|uniref:Uncharacterized protein n=1 Tax=Streptomyces albus (strain ATCC 21838 / DSM 41398 / FERM P-419 / JCM 4703 / NBRC 107858) TaxID=1081613 RepID=A0A0B5F9K6_STRA4|nr:hypothetical protein SLNWT_7145 [Streptomyces albus]AOU81825.1 hypothetical protein SLNHY_7134 [Streptomyces albus]AYN37511.1 hypothetical protein DUI70_7018 [Streptomyces albus]
MKHARGVAVALEDGLGGGLDLVEGGVRRNGRHRGVDAEVHEGVPRRERLPPGVGHHRQPSPSERAKSA